MSANRASHADPAAPCSQGRRRFQQEVTVTARGAVLFCAGVTLYATTADYVPSQVLRPPSAGAEDAFLGTFVRCAWAILLAVFAFELLIARRGWRGHLCPMGACYRQTSHCSLLRVHADGRERCDGGMDCPRAGPEPSVTSPALQGDRDPLFLDLNCTNCGRCIDACALQVFRFGAHSRNTMEAAS